MSALLILGVKSRYKSVEILITFLKIVEILKITAGEGKIQMHIAVVIQIVYKIVWDRRWLWNLNLK